MQVKAATESFRNEMVRSNSVMTKVLAHSRDANSVSGTVGSHTLSTPELASHNHPVTVPIQSPNPNPADFRVCPSGNQSTDSTFQSGNAGGGGGHSHPFSGTLSSTTAPSASFAIPAMDLKHANVIIAAKD